MTMDNDNDMSSMTIPSMKQGSVSPALLEL